MTPPIGRYGRFEPMAWIRSAIKQNKKLEAVAQLSLY